MHTTRQTFQPGGIANGATFDASQGDGPTVPGACVFTTAHTRTAQSANIVQRRRRLGDWRPLMLLSVIAVILVIAVCALTSAVRVGRGVIPTDLGSMSEKWMVDYRGSREW